MAKRTYTYDGSSWQGLASPAVSLSNYPNMTTTPISGFRNAIINGDMDIWQRGTSGIVPTSTQPYSADRWESYRAGYAAGMSVYRPAGPTGITYAARVQRDVGNTSTANMAFGQPIESMNSTRFAGKNVTLSFWARAGANFSSASSILTAQVTYGTGTDQNYRSGFTGNTVVVSSPVTLTTSWQRFTISGNVSATATQVGVQFSYTPIGTAGAADHFEITGVQLEEGLIATPFEQRPVGLELSLCQRYFYSRRANDTDKNWGWGWWEGNNAFITFVHPCEMRIAPAFSFNGTSGIQVVYPAVAWYNVSGTISNHHNGTKSSNMLVGITGASVPQSTQALMATTGTGGALWVSAEL